MRLFRDPAAGAGAGGQSSPTLADIIPDDAMSSAWSGNYNNDEQTTTKPDGTEGADAGKTADAGKAEDAAKTGEAGKEASTTETGDTGKADEKKPGEEDKKPEGDAAGTETGGESEEEASPEEFYNSVDQITGTPVKVEYGEVDPLSPEGVAIREKAVRNDAVLQFDRYMRESDPRAYAYFQHRKAGRPDSEFLEQKTLTLPDLQTFNDSVDLQSTLYKSALINAGVPEDIAEASVAKAIKDNALLAKATEVYNRTATAEKAQLAKIEADVARDEAAFEQLCSTVTKNLNSQIDKGDLKFIIPDAKKPEFKQFVTDSIRVDDGKFYVVQELGEDPKALLESLYFKFINGDLSAMVERRAETKTVQRLKAGVNKSKSASAKGSASEKNQTSYVALGDI